MFKSMKMGGWVDGGFLLVQLPTCSSVVEVGPLSTTDSATFRALVFPPGAKKGGEVLLQRNQSSSGASSGAGPAFLHSLHWTGSGLNDF